MTLRRRDPKPSLAEATERLVEAAITERAAEQACRSRPWEDRIAWVALLDATLARRQAVDALVRIGASA